MKSVVAVIDIANWSASPAELNLRDFRAVAEGLDEPVRVAPSSTRAIAEKLGTAPINEDLTLTIRADESARVALAFSVPATSADHALTIGDFSLPLDDLLELTISRSDLPPVALPAEVVPAEIVSASDGKTMRVLIDGETDSRRIQLTGVEPPVDGDCFVNDAEKVLDDLAGVRVLVEGDSEVSGGRIPVRYIWLINPDGTRTLLNQSLVAQGFARVGSLPAAARFGLWLTLTEETAKANGEGLWSGCETPEIPTRPATSATPDRQPTSEAPDSQATPVDD